MAAQPDGQRQIEPQRADARQQGQDRPAASQRSDENGLRIESYADPRPVAAGTAAGVGSGLEVMRALLKRETLLGWPFWRATIVTAAGGDSKKQLGARGKIPGFSHSSPGIYTRHGDHHARNHLKRADAAHDGANAALPPAPAIGAPRKLYIRTFGCQMNEYDSDKMADVLRGDQELELTENPEEADVILFNTCSVREKAQEKVFSDLGRVQHLKKLNPNLVIGVGGCVASQEGEAIVKRAPYVDVVFGPQTLHRLPDLIERRRAEGRSQVDISFPKSRNSTPCRRRAWTAPPPLSPSWKAVASIAASAWCPTRAARKSRARSTTC